MIRHTETRMMLVILDGWGHGPNADVSAIDQAETPVMDRLYEQYPNAELTTFGNAVGLPEGQMGNSEVGHLNIGAGRVIDQELVRIGKAIQNGTLAENQVLLEALAKAQARSARIHVMGLVSDGGVHSHIDHLKALCEIIERETDVPAFIHAFTDGRDVDPKSGLGFIREMQEFLTNRRSQLATVTGRYYAMDRDKRWERTKIAYDAIVHGQGTAVRELMKGIEQCYADGVTDEFIKPLIQVGSDDLPITTVADGDMVLFFNFRTDRPRQLVTVLCQEDMPDLGMQTMDIQMVTMTEYDHHFHDIEVLFEQDDLTRTLGEVIAKTGRSQLRIAETEKYPHVTYFFSGGREAPFDGEERVLIPSPKVATYDLQPEMSAPDVTDAAIRFIREHEPDFVCLNFANADMVGHTGVFTAGVRAVETVDSCLGRLLEVALEHQYGVIVIADHGNADTMINPDGSPNTAHTMNPVPIIYVSKWNQGYVSDGILADIAPTILALMGIPKPDVMTGNCIVT